MFKRSLLATLISLVLASCVSAKDAPKPGSFYSLGELGISKTEVRGSKIKLTFKPKDEQFYWCPGARIETVKKATVVTFVRCKTSKSCAVDAKAAIGKRLIRTITIDTGGKDTYVRISAKKLKRIYKAPTKSTKKVKNAKPAKPESPSTKTTSNDSKSPVMVTNQFARPAN